MSSVKRWMIEYQYFLTFILKILSKFVMWYLKSVLPLAVEPVYVDPCDPNPCGPNSNPPRVIGDRCQCSCLPEMIGSPPNCRPECTVNSDCPQDEACINRKCQDPCPGLCGVNAVCNVRNHIPLCQCIQGYVGDPFSQCYRPTSKFILDYRTIGRGWCKDVKYFLHVGMWFQRFLEKINTPPPKNGDK